MQRMYLVGLPRLTTNMARILDDIQKAAIALDRQDTPKEDRKMRVTRKQYEELSLELTPYLKHSVVVPDKLFGFKIEIVDET